MPAFLQAVPTKTSVRFTAADGYLIGGTLYQSPSPSSVRTPIVFHSACGTPSSLYGHFAEFMAIRGFPILVFDYRGIHRSRHQNLRGFDAGFEDWCELDCAAAWKYMRSRYPDRPLTAIGHSVGCLLMTASPRACGYSQFVAICPHTAYLGDYAMPWSIAATIFYRLVMPGCAKVLGYFPSSVLFGGENLPARVALQWSARLKADIGATPKHWDAARLGVLLETLRRTSGPALVLSTTDDVFASESAVRRFVFAARGLSVVRRNIDPGERVGTRIGHWGLFSRRCMPIVWPVIATFVDDLVSNGIVEPTMPQNGRLFESQRTWTVGGARFEF